MTTTAKDAARAVDAYRDTANAHGIDSPQAIAVGLAAERAAQRALAAGATVDQIRAERGLPPQ